MKLRRAALLIASSWLLAGCGVVTDPADVTPEVYVESAAPHAGAAAVFGQERVDEAVSELTEFALKEAFPPALLDPERVDYSREDLAGEVITGRLTPEAAQGWETLVDAALDGDPEARSAVRVMRYFDVEEPWTLPGDDPVVSSQQITDVEIDVDSTDGAGHELLVVSFDHTAALEFHEQGQPVGLEVEKEMTYHLTPAPAQQGPSWLIAEFDGEF